MRLLLTSALVLVRLGFTAAQEGLTIEVIRSVYCSLKTKNGDLISVDYNGTLTDGTLFDSSTHQCFQRLEVLLTLAHRLRRQQSSTIRLSDWRWGSD